MTHIDLSTMPNLQEINRKLIAGFHLSENDLPLWQELDAQEASYTALFQSLGHKLIRDSRGFFYIYSDDSTVTMGKTSRSFALTIYCLVEFWANKGMDPTHALFDKDIDLELLQHLVQEHFHLFEQLDIESGSDLRKEVFSRLIRFGLAKEYGAGYRLLSPVYRYLDALSDVDTESLTQETSDDDTPEGELNHDE